MDVSAEDYAAFQAFQAQKAAREQDRTGALWARWAREVNGDTASIFRAYRMAVKLMAEHGVSAWTLKIGHARYQDGSIRYKYKPGTKVWDGNPGTLTLSGPLMSVWTEEQQRTLILHEIAHIKCPDDGHGPWWGWHCHALGIEPRRCWGEEEIQRAMPAIKRRRRNP